MFDAVAASIDLGPEPDPTQWREQLEALAYRIVEAMDDHPGIARVPLANVPTGQGAARVADRTLALLRAGDVDDRSAAWFIDVVSLYINATAYETSIYMSEGTTEDNIDEQIRDDFARLAADEFPNLTRLMGPLTSGTGEERFAFGLRLLINGLLNTPPPPA